MGRASRKIKRRNAPKPGQTYEQANPTRIVGVESDVLDLKRRIETDFPGIEVTLDQESEEWVIVEHCRDGQDRLCFAIPCSQGLDQRVYDRVARADAEVQARLGIDLADVLEKEQDEEWRRRENELGDKIQEAGERLLHALRKDGVDAGIPKIFPSEKRDPMNRRLLSGRRLLEDRP